MAIAGGDVKARSESGETQRTRISLPRLMSSGYGTADLGVRVPDVRGVTLCGESPIKMTADRVASGPFQLACGRPSVSGLFFGQIEDRRDGGPHRCNRRRRASISEGMP
jgi:hypothetical protein